MSSTVWRNAGLSYQICSVWSHQHARYIQYLEMCSRVVRYALKEPHRSVAIKRGEQGLKSAKWSDGKQGDISTSKRHGQSNSN